jgi:cyclophilin family peptidyl-prolyl cis-trans isomerase
MRAILLSTLAALVLIGCTPDNSSAQANNGGSQSSSLESSVQDTSAGTVQSPALASSSNPVVVIETSMGTITAELWADKAPITVENFLRYTDSSFFDGLVFHRVIPGFMIQGGGYGPDLVEKSNFAPIKNEARGDTPNNRGTLAMARTSVVDSATSQFFINLVDNAFLNHTDETPAGFGYAVFGQVLEGFDTLDAIAVVPTGPGRFGHQNVPTEPVFINSVKRAQ